DTLGHAMGDLLLYRVGDRLMHTLRNSDAIFRIGGDEFAVIIENIPDDKSIQNVAQKVVNAVCAPILLEKDKVVVGASIGISQYPSYAKTKSALVSTADIAMYEAKSKGKNSFQMYKT
ncbi:MAG TPA: GGDEF domain-containing protein, partial [Sulfurospirillum sp. UBA11407]